jgi:hypothetical protein
MPDLHPFQRLKTWFRNHTKTETRQRTAAIISNLLQPKDRAVRKPQRRQIYQRLYKDQLAPKIAEEMVKTRPPLDDEEGEAPASLKARRMAAMQKVVKDSWPKEDAEVVEAVEAEFERQMKDLEEKDEEAGEAEVGEGSGRTPQQYLE